MSGTFPMTMEAMVLEAQGKPLRIAKLPVPQPGANEILVRVHACGVCRTDLHVLDGDLKEPKLPLVLGHEIVGTVAAIGKKPGAHGGKREAERAVARSGKRSAERAGGDEGPAFQIGDRVGVPWLGYTDGTCRYCLRGDENLCDHPKFTGYTIDGGYAEYAVADRRYSFHLPDGGDDASLAPLLCAGLIGYRSYRLAGSEVGRLGIYGFGGAGHIVAQVARYEGKEVYAFTRPGDVETQEFARSLGVTWAGDSDVRPPVELDAAIVLAPVGALMVEALRATAKGGVVVSGGIHMSDIPAFPYRLLWEERVFRSVANLTRRDGEEFLSLAPRVPVRTEIETFPLMEANEALDRLRSGKLRGAAVLRIAPANARSRPASQPVSRAKTRPGRGAKSRLGPAAKSQPGPGVKSRQRPRAK